MRKAVVPGIVVPDLGRRQFLGHVTTAGVAVGLGCLNISGMCGPVGNGASARALTAAAFEPYVGGRFYFHGGKDGPLCVELVEARAHRFDPNRPPHVRREPFTLIFRAAAGTRFEDQMGTICHARLGAVETFLSRVDIPDRGVDLQAVFG